MPTPFLGGREFLYQAYVYAFFTSTATVLKATNDLKYNRLGTSK
jgi:hypothetical protein